MEHSDSPIDILDRLKKLASDPRIPHDVRKDMLSDLRTLLAGFKGGEEEDGGEEEHLCPSCSGADVPQIQQIMAAPINLRAVYAEGDRANPTQMSVDPVVAMALMKDTDGDTFITGVSMTGEFFVECETVRTFMGYLKEGENPDKYAGKVREFLSKMEKEKGDEPG